MDISVYDAVYILFFKSEHHPAFLYFTQRVTLKNFDWLL